MLETIVVGGGFFGLYIAEHMARMKHRVTLVESGSEPMLRASYVNQARVHNGYHYPRSVLTALRSRVSFPRFVEEFRGCIHDEFQQYYLIASILSKVTSKQFLRFCRRIGADCEPAPFRVTNLLNPQLIEAAFLAREFAFDSLKLRRMMRQRVANVGVTIRYGTSLIGVSCATGGQLRAKLIVDGQTEETGVDHIFNCTYSMLNLVNVNSGAPIIPLRHELTELCLVRVPEELERVGFTVMCGPFFSCMPFPSESCHSFSHVRYTPHAEWRDHEGRPYLNGNKVFDSFEKTSAWQAIRRDAARYIPVLSECERLRSIWEVKTILPKSDVDDSRPILFRPHHGFRGYHCIMGGKIDNVYDATRIIDQIVN